MKSILDARNSIIKNNFQNYKQKYLIFDDNSIEL